MTDVVLPTPQQEQRAKWDVLLLEIEQRTEQIRQMKAFEGWRLAIQSVTAAATIFAAGGVVGGLIVKVFHLG